MGGKGCDTLKTSANNIKTIKNDNRALILNIIRKAPISRADISKRTGLSKSSVTIITNALINEGRLVEIGTDESLKGRKPILLDIVADYRYAAGIILHRKEVRVCLTDLKCDVIASESSSIFVFKTAEEILDYAAKTFFDLVDKSGLTLDRCIGIGISSPGPLDRESGVILSPPSLEILHNLKVVEGIKNRVSVKNVVLENNAVLLAMRENVLQSEHEMKNFISVIVSHGIGSAIVTNGEIYRGAGGFSGELGHISVEANGIECACGNRGCLERYASLDAVKKKFGFEHYRDMVELAYEGDEKALEIMEYIVGYLGAGLVTAINLFDLDAVILHGDYSYKPRLINSMLKKYIEENSFVAKAHRVYVIDTTGRREKEDGNSTAAVIEQYFYQTMEE